MQCDVLCAYARARDSIALYRITQLHLRLYVLQSDSELESALKFSLASTQMWSTHSHTHRRQFYDYYFRVRDVLRQCMREHVDCTPALKALLYHGDYNGTISNGEIAFYDGLKADDKDPILIINHAVRAECVMCASKF